MEDCFPGLTVSRLGTILVPDPYFSIDYDQSVDRIPFELIIDPEHIPPEPLDVHLDWTPPDLDYLPVEFLPVDFQSGMKRYSDYEPRSKYLDPSPILQCQHRHQPGTTHSTVGDFEQYSALARTFPPPSTSQLQAHNDKDSELTKRLSEPIATEPQPRPQVTRPSRAVAGLDSRPPQRHSLLVRLSGTRSSPASAGVNLWSMHHWKSSAEPEIEKYTGGHHCSQFYTLTTPPHTPPLYVTMFPDRPDVITTPRRSSAPPSRGSEVHGPYGDQHLNR